MGESLTCYRCHAQYRGFEEIERHGGFDLETHERYRQMAARMKDDQTLSAAGVSRSSRQQSTHRRLPTSDFYSVYIRFASDSNFSMDPEQQRIEEDLRGLLQGDVRCDDVFTQLYASDASIYELRPLGVVRPRTVDDVVATVRYAAENHLPIHARGAGTGLAGESLGRGLVSISRAIFAASWPIDDDRVRVQPGVVLSHAESLPRRKRPAVRPRPGHAKRHHDGQRRGHRRRRQPLAALRLGPAARRQSCKSCWPTATCIASAGIRMSQATATNGNADELPTRAQRACTSSSFRRRADPAPCED